jgi:hypothetical protein
MAADAKERFCFFEWMFANVKNIEYLCGNFFAIK